MAKNDLKTIAKGAKLSIKDGHIVCPVCRMKTRQIIRPETEAKNLQVFCAQCKSQMLVNIKTGQCSFVSPC